MNMKAIAVIVVLVAGVLIGVSMNNQLVASNEACGAAWAQVDTVLQRRYDLIPNLVNTVKGYAAHEKGVLEEITRLRSQWGAAKTPSEKAEIASQLEGGLSRLLLVAENYPALKANENFKELQYELAGTENRISVERQRYNETVRTYNTKVRMFPWSLIASLHGFKPDMTYFKADTPAKDAPKVQF